MIADWKIDVVVAWGVAAGCALWGHTERKAKLRERKEKDDRIIALEKNVDPNRTSSGLTPDGNLKETGIRT